MIVGKTLQSISKAEILNQFSEVQILASVFPYITSVPCLISSPLRTDDRPSFSIYMSDGGHIYYKDYGISESGGLWDLLCKYWNCTIHQALNKICDLLISKKNIEVKPKQIKTLTRRENYELKQIQVVVRPFRDYDYEYWESYGITRKWLRYAEVYPISHKIVIKKDHSDDKGHKYIFPADKYAYVFTERKEGKLQLKIYQPFNTKGFKWCSKMDGSVVGLWSKIPEYGDRVIICSSLKDALCVSCQLNIPTLCLQGEGYGMSDTAIKELKRRYKKVFISFDTDKAGREDSAKLAKETGFINVIPDFGKYKDFSDYYKSLENKEEFKKLSDLF